MQALLVLWAASSTVFAQAPEERLRVADVRIQGSDKIAAPTVQSYLKTRRGCEYDNDVLQEDVRTLVAAKLFADVRAQVEKLPNGRVNVYFLLRDPPKTIQRIEYRGAKHFKDDELKAITGLTVGAPLRPPANRVACQSILRKYNDSGRPFAECRLLRGDQDNDSEVVFVITEGPKYQISDLRFTGNRFVGSDVLATHIRSSRIVLGILNGDFNRELIDEDVGKLIEYYNTFGFHDIRITSEVQYQPDGYNAVVVFHINEGVRYRIKDVPDVVGFKKVPERRELEEVLKVKPGEFYNGRALQRGADEIRDWYGWQGYDAKVEVVRIFSQDEPGIVRVRYEVDPHQRTR